mgnify:CR=1 FL=1
MKKFLLIAAVSVLFSTQAESVDFCAKETGNGSCTQCENTFTLKNGRCLCGTNFSQYTPGATYVDALVKPVQCRSCSAYFPITGGQCSKCGMRWAGSWKCYAWTCNSGYYTVGGNSCEANGCCKPCSTISVSNGKCTACSSAEKCTAVSCNAGYRANGSTCEKISCSAGQYVNGNACAACPSGQWSSGGTATSCRPCSNIGVANGSCAACSTTGACTAVSCNAGYRANGAACEKISCSAGQYVNGNACAACPSGQWSSGGTATSCRPCSNIGVANGTCTACSADGAACTAVSCASGYTLSNGACVKTPTCTSGQYTGSDGSCRPCSDISIANGTCLNCSSSSQCDNISCDSGYVWMGGQTCVKAATCQYPLKEVADYSGECAGCCTD